MLCLGSDGDFDLQDLPHTYEDTYSLCLETEKGVREKVRVYEVGGGSPNKLGQHFVLNSDAVIIMFDLSNYSSFLVAQKLKEEVDSGKDKRESVIALVGNKMDRPKDSQLDISVSPSAWAHKEKIMYFETSSKDKQSLTDILRTIVMRILQPGKPFSFGKRDQR
ncbi:hypothetical protein AAHC03_020639 [Spirometra sp. Aus1]|nr:unnamed protein product [Spirometra erinaceieuropaei]